MPLWDVASSIHSDLGALSLLKLYGAEAVENRMPTRHVVDAFDVIEDI